MIYNVMHVRRVTIAPAACAVIAVHPSIVEGAYHFEVRRVKESHASRREAEYAARWSGRPANERCEVRTPDETEETRIPDGYRVIAHDWIPLRAPCCDEY